MEKGINVMPKNKLAKAIAPATAQVSTMPTNDRAKMEAEERRYRAEDALRDFERVEKHKANKVLMSDVKKCAKDKIKSMSKITGK
jgi:hypothetical protein